jgi:8-oxo-dGTP diphosphatase
MLGPGESELEQEPEGAMAREQIMAAGGIVLRREQPPLVAVVRLRKRDEWVLPKGKLDDGETPRDAAKREVLEETGHNVTVHEFLGTLVVDTGTRSKVVHYWRMEAGDAAARPLMDDVRAVDWLPLDDAVERLSRSHEKTFLENVGPYALAGLIRRTKAKPAAEEQAVASKPVAAKPVARPTAATKPTAPKVAAAKPATTRKRRPATEPAEPAIAPEAAPAPVEAAPIEIMGNGIAPVAAVPAEDTTLQPVAGETHAPETRESETLGSETNVTDAEIEADRAGAPEDLVAEVPAPAAKEAEVPVHHIPAEVSEQVQAGMSIAISDVERVQAVAVEIKSMLSQAAARESAAGASQTDESHREPRGADSIAERVPSQPATAEAVTAETRQGATEPADRTEPQRRTLAQKVRGWFGHAA